MNAQVWKYKLQTIADATGQPVSTVRRHRREGRFEPGDLRSVALYICGVVNGELACRKLEVLLAS